MSPEHDLTGKPFHDWTVLRYAGRKNRETRWLCRCKCGREGEVAAGNLRSGHSTQCRVCSGRKQHRIISHQGKTASQTEWAESLGLTLSSLRNRLRKYPVAVALRKKLPARTRTPNEKLLTFDGTTLNVSKWAKRLGCSKQALYSRLKNMSVEEALAMPVSNTKKQAGRKAYLSRITAVKEQ